MAFRKPDEIAELAVESGVKKVHSPLSALIVLGFWEERLSHSVICLISVSSATFRKNGEACRV